MPDDAMNSPEQRAQVEAVKVEQVDRDAAACLLLDDYGPRHPVANIRNGLCDNDLYVQAFARHRIAAQSARPPADQDEVDAVAEVRSKINDEKLGKEARRRMMRDMTGGFYDHHLVRAAVEWAATAAIEALRPFREAAEAKAREDAWQPIETAPKDGTHVVVHARLGHNGKVRRSRRGCFVNVAHFEPSWGWLTSPSDYQIKPTLWRPLPAPPALEQGEG
jgi:hypothetical protein